VAWIASHNFAILAFDHEVLPASCPHLSGLVFLCLHLGLFHLDSSILLNIVAFRLVLPSAFDRTFALVFRLARIVIVDLVATSC